VEYLYRFNGDGGLAYGPDGRLEITQTLLDRTGELYPDTLPKTVTRDMGTAVRAIIEGSAVQRIEAIPGPTERYVAVDISGNSGFATDGTLTFIPGDIIQITMTLKVSSDAGAATLEYSTDPGVALSVPYRKNGVFAGRLRCPFVGGVCSFNLPVTEDMHGDLSIKQADLTPFGGNQVELLNEINVIVEKASA
jgi:hypothetical protein